MESDSIKSDGERQILYSITYMWKLRQSHRKRESQLLWQIQGWIKWKDVDQTVKTSSFKITKFWKPTSVQHQYKIKLKIYWAWPHQPEQDSVPWQPFPPIRKLPQASYPHPSEGRRNENHNHRKLTKLITWITTLSNSMKLWATSCTATQDGWVMVESSGKTWSTGEGMANHFSILALRTPWTVWKCPSVLSNSLWPQGLQHSRLFFPSPTPGAC